jgi:8-oxo-dGTP pyrophosphatase MutT (NUDIX family)
MTVLSDGLLRAVLEPVERGWRPLPPLRDAAVLAALFTRDGRDHLLFTQRRADLEHHPGEMSFPGGAREGDEDALECALRECEEELGLDPKAVTVLGQLSPLTSGAGFRVHAFVGRIPAPEVLGLRVDPREVDSLVPIEVSALRTEARWVWRPWTPPSGAVRRTPYFHYRQHVLWGLTARLTRELLQRVGDAEG